MPDQTQYIQSVQLTESGYLVNGNMSVPNDPGNRHYNDVQEWIAEGNTPTPIPQPTPEQLALAKLQELYANVKRFIETLPNGWIRYDNDLKMNIMAYGMNALAQGHPLPQLCVTFNTWKAAVEQEFLALKAVIESGDLTPDVSVAMFESKYGREGSVLVDPSISTADLV